MSNVTDRLRLQKDNCYNSLPCRQTRIQIDYQVISSQVNSEVMMHICLIYPKFACYWKTMNWKQLRPNLTLTLSKWPIKTKALCQKNQYIFCWKQIIYKFQAWSKSRIGAQPTRKLQSLCLLDYNKFSSFAVGNLWHFARGRFCNVRWRGFSVAYMRQTPSIMG